MSELPPENRIRTDDEDSLVPPDIVAAPVDDFVLVRVAEEGEPRPLKAACHDGTPFITLQHECGFTLHLHEGQIAAAPAAVEEIGTRCHGCKKPIVLRVSFVRDAFRALRAAGWVDDS